MQFIEHIDFLRSVLFTVAFIRLSTMFTGRFNEFRSPVESPIELQVRKGHCSPFELHCYDLIKRLRTGCLTMARKGFAHLLRSLVNL